MSRRKRLPLPAGRRMARLSAAAGVAAAVILATMINILSARHYRRWDWTEQGLFTLSNGTRQTLRSIDEPVEIYVLLSDADPLSLSVRHLLEAYRGETSMLVVEHIDPDQRPAELLAVQSRFGIDVTRSEGGQVVADTSIVVAQGERHHFVTANELVTVDPGEELAARGRIEGALTSAIAQVVAGTPPLICFTAGHGEPPLDVGGAEGLLGLQVALRKSNHEVVELPALQDLRGNDPIRDCDVVVVPGPSRPLADEEVKRLVAFVKGGGSLLLFAGPEMADGQNRFQDLGLDRLLALAGVRLHQDFIFERDPTRSLPNGQGESFFAEPNAHPITQPFVALEGTVGIPVAVVASLEADKASAVAPSPLLTTSSEAFGMRDFFGWAESRREPAPQLGDRRGPLVIAYASELPKLRADDAHGPRIVVVGTKSAVLGANWQSEMQRGTAAFVENALSWLADEPIVFEVGGGVDATAEARLTESDLSSAFYKLVLLLPLSVVLIGMAVAYRRRAAETRPGSADDDGDGEDDARRDEGEGDEDAEADGDDEEGSR